MTDQEKLSFIDNIAKYVKMYAPIYGICVYSPIIAQACLESAYGTSNKAKYHNYFGLKYREGRLDCHNGYFSDGGSEQSKNGSYTPITTDWFSFSDMEHGVEGYFQFINISNYNNLKGVTDPRTYLEYIKSDGYATSINYVDKVMNVINKWNLTKYDNLKEEKTMNFSTARIAIDAGHGSETPGKRHPDGYREHYSNTYMAYYLDQILTKNGATTLKVAWDDTNAKDDPDISLATRQAQIKAFKADVVISIHADASSSKSASGVSTYHHSNANYVGDSVAFAKCVQPEMIKGTKQKDRGVRSGAFAIINCSKNGAKASVLIETAFMTNEAESALLKSDEFCLECARDMARGIFKYYGYNGNADVAVTRINGTTTTSGSSTTTSKSIKTGDEVVLKSNTVFYSSSSSSGSKKSGTFYVWSNQIVNNRVRITNKKDRVGVSGQVTGWLSVSDITGNQSSPSSNVTTSNNTNSSSDKSFKAGDKVVLKSTKVYASTAKTAKSSVKSGTFYIWSSTITNNRIRITNATNKVGVSGQVTGWVNISDITTSSTNTVTNTSSVKYIKGGVDYAPVFDPIYYANRYPDVKKIYGTATSSLLTHFVSYGMKEGRQAKSTFNVNVYKNNNPDLSSLFGNDWTKYYKHYIEYGKNENRKSY